MSSRKTKHNSSRDNKEGKQQDGPIRQLMLQACNERPGVLTEKEHAQHVDAGEQQITLLGARYTTTTPSSAAAAVAQQQV
jgi:hypothetical protein